MLSDQNNNHTQLFEGHTVPPLVSVHSSDGSSRGRQASRCAKSDCRQRCDACLFSPANLEAFERWQADGFKAPETAPRCGSSFIALVRDGEQQIYVAAAYSVTRGQFVYSIPSPFDTVLGETVDVTFQDTTDLLMLGWRDWEGEQ